MTNKPQVLKPHELNFIKEREAAHASIMETFKKVSQFKTGDFLIAFILDDRLHTRKQITNSYGAPKKFIVVYTNKFGAPYVKELNKKGDAVGQLICLIHTGYTNQIIINPDCEFEIDPDYTDAIIMDDEANYNATHIHKMNSDMFKTITKHNKSLRVDVDNNASLLNYLKTQKVGDIVWKSIKTYFTILTLDPIPVTHKGTRVQDDVKFGTAQDSKGKVFDISSCTFKYRAIYTSQPRSYKELKDLK